MTDNPTIEFEVPTAWCNHPLVGKQHQTLVTSIREAIKILNLNLVECSVPANGDFIERNTKNIRIAYHCNGNKPNVWRLKEGPLPYYFTFDRQGYSGWSEFSKKTSFPEKDHKFIRDWFTQFSNGIIKNNISKYPQKSTNESCIAEPYIFYPLQLANDTVMKLSRLDYYDVLLELCNCAESSNKKLVIKIHPLCNDNKLRLLIDGIKSVYKNVLFSEESIHPLISNSYAVICCNSGVGFEALLHGKAVYNFGDSDYKQAAHQVTNINQLKQIFQINSTPTPPISVDSFLWNYFSDFCFDCRNIEETIRHIKKTVNEYKNLRVCQS